jgi:hypothetical protein
VAGFGAAHAIVEDLGSVLDLSFRASETVGLAGINVSSGNQYK